MKPWQLLMVATENGSGFEMANSWIVFRQYGVYGFDGYGPRWQPNKQRRLEPPGLNKHELGRITVMTACYARL